MPDPKHTVRSTEGAPTLLVGPMPPPIHGLSAAFATVVDGYRNAGWPASVVDLAERTGRRGGAFSLRRAVGILAVIGRVWVKIFHARVLYLNIAQSRMGFLRDLAICTPAVLFRKRFVVHLNGGNFSGFYGAQSRPIQALARWMLGAAERIIVLSECLRSDFSMVPGWQDRTAVVWNPATVPVGTPKKRPSAVLRILYLSNLLLEKGYRDVLEALPRLAERLPGWRIEADFAGAFLLGRDGFRDADEMKRDFDALAAKVPPAVSVKWHGVARGDAKQALLDSADVFVLPTYYVNEGQPLAIIEALAAGLPVVATAYRAIPEMLPPSHLALSVPPRDSVALAEKFTSLALDGDRYEQLSRDAIEQARLFDPKLHVERIAALL